MTSIERTAYPRFGHLVSARELTGLSPSTDEVAWATDLARSDAHLLAPVLSLKCFQRLGYFPRRDDVPGAVVDHVRRCLDLAEGVQPEVGSDGPGCPSTSWYANGSAWPSTRSGPGRSPGRRSGPRQR